MNHPTNIADMTQSTVGGEYDLLSSQYLKQDFHRLASRVSSCTVGNTNWPNGQLMYLRLTASSIVTPSLQENTTRLGFEAFLSVADTLRQPKRLVLANSNQVNFILEMATPPGR